LFPRGGVPTDGVLVGGGGEVFRGVNSSSYYIYICVATCSPHRRSVRRCTSRGRATLRRRAELRRKKVIRWDRLASKKQGLVEIRTEDLYDWILRLPPPPPPRPPSTPRRRGGHPPRGKGKRGDGRNQKNRGGLKLNGGSLCLGFWGSPPPPSLGPSNPAEAESGTSPEESDTLGSARI